MSTGGHQGSLVKSQLLYQLSYAGARVIVFAESSSTCRHGHGRPPALLSKLLSNPKTVVKPHGVRKGQIAGVSGPCLRRQELEVASERRVARAIPTQLIQVRFTFRSEPRRFA